MKIKICGIFRSEDAVAVNEALPDFAGFVFVPESRRYVSPETAAVLRKQIDVSVETVGVFRNAQVSFVAAIVRAGTIGIVQLHGNEDEAYIAALRAEPGMADIPIVKAVSVTDAASVSRPCGAADFLLFDNGTGGTGERFDTEIIRAAKADGTLPSKPFFIAGGVNEDNIVEIIALEPYGIDISGGAETDGLKNSAKIAALVWSVRAAQSGDEI